METIYYTIYISLGIILASTIYMAIFDRYKVGKVVIAVALLIIVCAYHAPLFIYIPHHCSCKARLEGEAYNVEAAMAAYFSEPQRTQIPSISDLVNTGCYTYFKENADLVRESQFEVTILGRDFNDSMITVSTKAGRCPFQEGECPWSKGQVYVKKIHGEGEWLDSDEAYERIILYREI